MWWTRNTEKSPPVQRSIWRSGGMSGWEMPSISSTRSAGAFERSKNSPPGALTSWQCGWSWNQNRLCEGISPPWFCSKNRRAWSVWKCDVQQSLSPHLLLTAHGERGWGLLFYVIGIAAWPHPKFPAGDMRNKRWGGLEILLENPGAEPLDSNPDSGLSAVRSEPTGPPAPRSVLPLL